MSDNDDIEVDSDVSMATFNLLKMLFLLAGDLAELAAQLALATNNWLVVLFYLISSTLIGILFNW